MLRIWPLLCAAVAVVVADQYTKKLVVDHLPLYDGFDVVPGLFSILHVRNPGALFGLFRDLPSPWRGLLLTSLSVVALACVLVFLYQSAARDRWTRVALALVLGGAVGNLIDRVRLGYVVDFLDVYVSDHHWPTFNVADSCICVGIGLLLWRTLVEPAADHEDGATTRDGEPEGPASPSAS